MISPPLEKIRHACEALMLLGESERKRAGITGGEVKEAERIYALASTFPAQRGAKLVGLGRGGRL